VNPNDTPRKRILSRLGTLTKEQSSWRSHWQELNDWVLPRRLRYLSSDVNKGSKRNDKIINSTPIRSARVLQSGMMAGITSPARPWFRLGTPDPDRNENVQTKGWIHVVETRMREVFHRSNLYNCLPLVYTDLGVFGTSCMFVEEDDEDVVRGYTLPLGQYVLQNSARLAVDTVLRAFQMTTAQMIEKFGRDAVSQQVRDEYDRGDYDIWHEVVHAVMPNSEYDGSKADYRGMLYKSVWLEKAGSDQDQPLRVGGFNEFPAMAPRWNVTGEDVYGYSPGMDALGDCRALQLLERRKSQALDKIVNPPMVGPSSLRNQRASLLPGDLTTVDMVQGGQTYKPAVEINSNAIKETEAAIREHESRIEQAFFADLWLMLASSDRREITAREVDERHEEKMLQLGPVLERLHDELLDPLIDRVFNIMLRKNMFPRPPDSLSGQPLRVEYISIMAQAQKLLFTTGIERLAGFVGNLAATDKRVVRRVNFDEAVQEYARLLGTSPKIIATDEQVAAAEAADAQAAQAQQAAVAAPAMADTAKAAQLLSETDTSPGKDSAFSRLMGSLGGGAPPAPGIGP
jgi:Bacteriophage head to tail connecting protein